MKDYTIFDAHADTISAILDENKSLYKNDKHIDICSMKEYRGFIQCFAAFIEPKYVKSGKSLDRFISIVEKLQQQVKEYGEHISLCRNAVEINDAIDSGKVAVIITLEGGEAFEENLLNATLLSQMGVRAATITWNANNALASCVISQGELDYGLTPLGKDMVAAMENADILVDVSHLGDNAFWDVMGVATKPVIASHSNSRTICSARRNLTDEQFTAICKTGGVVGINLCDDFIKAGGGATISDVIAHIKHFLSLAGEEHIGFGADFDGATVVEALCGADKMDRLLDAMLEEGISEDIIEKICYKNFMRVFN